MSWRKVLPAIGLAAACGVGGLDGDRPDMFGIEYDYVVGYHPDVGESIYGGSHYVVELGNGREAINAANSTTKIHPELKGDYVKFDPSISRGESSWDVFASNWWPQSRNGAAWRWTVSDTVSEEALSDHSSLDTLSPIEKYDWLFNPGQKREVKKVEHWNYTDLQKKEEERGAKHSHPAVQAMGPATEWELQHHGNYQEYHPDSWWGHCNGWAAYVTTEPLGAPKRDIKVKLDGGDLVECTHSTEGCVLVRMGDMEAMMSEVYFNDQATFGGQRCETAPDEMERDEFGRPTDEKCRDLNAGSFHIAITGLLGKGARHLQTGEQSKPSFIIDHNYDYQVWNFPITKYEIHTQEEIPKARAAELVGAHNDKYQFNPAAVKFAVVSMTYYMVSDSVGASAMLKQAGDRNIALHPTTLHYVLEMDAENNIVGGEWIRSPSTQWGSDNSKELHPDFLWMSMGSRGYYENADDTGGWSDNPYISKPNVDKLVKCANEPATCAGDEPPPTGDDDGNSDAGDTGGDDTAPAELSCDNQCGSSVTVGDQTCWCDEGCATYGDCCADFASECPAGGAHGDDDAGTGTATSPGTCAGHCGSTDPAPNSSPECYCDASCKDFGDCCGDYAATCE